MPDLNETSGNPEHIQDIFDTPLQIVEICPQIPRMPSVFISETGDETGHTVLFPGQLSLPRAG